MASSWVTATTARPSLSAPAAMMTTTTRSPCGSPRDTCRRRGLARALPHSIFDLFGTGPEYTLVDMSAAGGYAQAFAAAASRAKVPLQTLHLPDEPHLRRVWERDAVLPPAGKLLLLLRLPPSPSNQVSAPTATSPVP
ncbi:hypothetical protein COCHEDRAFT_1030950 [Bipolaris maydis C5]|uniref:Uncharacterized protein n=1 Tax=Cochliobolus heterostrophus (strain C5 / ATCC 48332 / race O) TaxID=701091 RepID=M2UTP3_COCH5|nr:hypothetical protein COCHEDRAFT_1030950 [Bipolaris maydis C5]KAJ6204992.1 hypothetical protein PSV09DRAFT_1030950 [Bipolaris maydis]